MGSKDSYICYIPKAPDAPSTRQEEAEAEADATPARSWSLLQPLSGTCIYVRPLFSICGLGFHISITSQHRQGWFTYSYCHNEQIRQFREQAQSVSRLPGPLSHPSNYSRLKFDTDGPPRFIPSFSAVYHSFSAFRAFQFTFSRAQSPGHFGLAD
jgi:protein OS-9